MKCMWTGALLAAAALIGLTGCGNDSTSTGSSGPATINILWAQWPPADALQTLGAEYQKQSGVAVNVVQKSWDGAFGDAVQNEFRTGGNTYDIIIGDSQWVGPGVKGGHYVELTDFIAANPDCFQDVAPAAMTYYAENPKGSKKYYAVPCESDAMAVAYRKDLFEDGKHKAAFAKFLAANKQPDFVLDVPKTWDQFYWIAKYFKEASGLPEMAGVVMPTRRAYDMVTMSFENVLWAYGGKWGDLQKNTVGIDSPETVEALKFFNRLLDQTPNGGRSMDYGAVASTYIAGNSAMAINFFAFFPQFASKDQNKDFWDKTGYFNIPAGPKGRFCALGGQGMSINAHISPERQQKAKDFLKWFSREQTQTRWAQLGGFTANTKVLNSDAFKNATPYNGLFAEAFSMVDDFWSVPEYDQLLEVAQREIAAVIQDKKDPAEAAKTMQRDHEAVMKKAGYLK